MKHYSPDFEQFRALAEKGNTIPVCRQLLADALTPVMAYQRLSRPAGYAKASHSFLLESVVGGERIARYSFAGADPDLTATAVRDELTIRRRGQTEPEVITTRDPLGELNKLMSGYKHVHLPGLPRFTGGIVGYAGYDVIRYYEDLGEGPADDRKLPDLSFGLYRTMVIFDHVSKTVKVVANAHVTGDPGQAYSEATEAIERTISRPARGHGPVGGGDPPRATAAEALREQLHARRLHEGRRGVQGVHPRGRHLPGRAVAAAEPRDRRVELRHLPCAARGEPLAVHVPASTRPRQRSSAARRRSSAASRTD